MRFHKKVEDILEKTEKRIADAKSKPLPKQKFERRSFKSAISRKPFSIISEIKFSSPSKGEIRRKEQDGIAEIARQMEDGKADALSVLSEPSFFGGTFENVSIAKKAAKLPVMMKDFFIDRFQMEIAEAYGADAVLLMVSVLGEKTKEFLDEAKRRKLDCLVECVSEEEVKIAVDSNAEIIGINNRSFSDFSVDLRRTEKLSKFVPEEKILVCESGIGNNGDIKRLLPFGVDAFLVGSSIMETESVSEKLLQLRGKEQ